MKRLRILSPLIIIGLLLAGGAQANPDPQKVVIETADRVLAEVTARKTELDANPNLIYSLVEHTVVPHFDFVAMVRSAMGRYWRQATETQQQALVNEFQQLLIRTYASALRGYSSQQIEYPPIHVTNDSDRVLVPTKVRPEGGPPIPIDYRLQSEDGKWKVYDVIIDGVSLVTNYRSSFARQIEIGGGASGSFEQRVSKGIDSLIQLLAKKNGSAHG